jgi:hypothetical protein
VLLFIGASDDLSKEFGNTGKKIEEMSQKEIPKLNDAKVFNDLKMSKTDHPAKSLLEVREEK